MTAVTMLGGSFAFGQRNQVSSHCRSHQIVADYLDSAVCDLVAAARLLHKVTAFVMLRSHATVFHFLQLWLRKVLIYLPHVHCVQMSWYCKQPSNTIEG